MKLTASLTLLACVALHDDETCSLTSFHVLLVFSGVTKVGVTQGGNLTVSPYFPFS